MANTVHERLEKLGINIPKPVAPVASYVGYIVHGGLVYVSGQLPFENGELKRKGILGDDVTTEEGVAAARLCAINLLAQVRDACGGDLERVSRCIRLGGFVASTADFVDQPKVINGASELIGAIFGDKGKHARAAVGVAALPLNACVEVEGLFALT